MSRPLGLAAPMHVSLAALVHMALATLALLAVSGCGNSRRAGPASEPMLVTSNDLVDGRRVFMHNCYQCHPGGQGGLGPAINNKPLPRFLMHTQIRQGFGAMPGFNEKDISDQELDHLLDYVVALRKAK